MRLVLHGPVSTMSGGGKQEGGAMESRSARGFEGGLARPEKGAEPDSRNIAQI